MSRFQAPTCAHLEPRGDLAPVKAGWWYCTVRGKEIYHAGHCAGCAHHTPGQVTPPAIKREAAMGKSKFDWDGPAQGQVPENMQPEDESLTLAGWAARVGLGAAAKALGTTYSTVQCALRGRGLVAPNKPRAAKKPKRQAAEPGTLDATTRERVAADTQEPPFLGGAAGSATTNTAPPLQHIPAEDNGSATLDEYAAYIADAGRAKHFEVWVSGYRTARAIFARLGKSA